MIVIGPDQQITPTRVESGESLTPDGFVDVPPTGRFVLAKNGKIIAAGVVL